MAEPLATPACADAAMPSQRNETIPKIRGNKVYSFEELYELESEQIDFQRPNARGIPSNQSKPAVRQTPAGEPWIGFTPHDRFGLALSGGGVRSATFNLGLLQTLARLGILPHVDYLSTVSGGGYIGSFWTAWLKRNQKNLGAAHFPLGKDSDGAERAEIRHLREFSRFLLPRVGLGQTEFWAIIMTVLGGMLPSLLAATAVLTTVWYIGILALIAFNGDAWWEKIVPGALVVLYLLTVEFKWRKLGRAERNPAEQIAHSVSTLVWGASVIAVFALVLNPNISSANSRLLWDTIIDPLTVLALPISVGLCTLGALGVRVVMARFLNSREELPILTGIERCVTRTIAITTGLFVMAGLWLLIAHGLSRLGEWELTITASGATLSAAIFAWAKKWLTEPLQETRGGSLLRFATNWLKRATPKFLAHLTWLLFLVVVGVLIQRWGARLGHVQSYAFFIPLFTCLAVIVLLMLLVDPARVGMHEFYRSRIARCYLGASNHKAGTGIEAAAQNRQVMERPDDDLTLGELSELPRPRHLICVAANDMSGDQLVNLYRGARSAVLSGNGISLGDQTAQLNDLRVSAAITASAAAFNSHMGRVSMDLGHAVGFLMSALNLRLGLWVQHPDNTRRDRYIFPGRFFFSELLGYSQTRAKNIHLSDGNHFENFGLYELVRRHCRYIIVSDCGADPCVAFDDLANVLRRVREDFGVEIELDIEPLRPGENKRAKQHAVMGTIHYDGIGGMDKGTILYFKPVLTGDESPDVLQYSTRNLEFPHEGTGDQFYDEAQWESYRRLGEHAAFATLGFFEPSPSARVHVVDRLFRDARSRWHPEPEDHQEMFLAMSERCSDLEQALMTEGPEQLRNEFFAEVVALSQQRAATDAPKKTATVPDLATEIEILSYLMRVTQIMEDIWVAAELERFWSHPLNEGWMNYFRRWASTPSFRRWWPIIAPMYSIGLREFVTSRFHVGAVDPLSGRAARYPGPVGKLALREIDNSETFFLTSYVAQQYRQSRQIPNTKGKRIFAYDLTLLGYEGTLSGDTLPIGFVILQEQRTRTGAEAEQVFLQWDADDLFVPDPLYGAGFVSQLLDGVLRHYRQNEGNDTRIEAQVNFPSGAISGETSATTSRQNRIGRAERYERVREIEFYKSRGFSYVSAATDETGNVSLRTVIA